MNPREEKGFRRCLVGGILEGEEKGCRQFPCPREEGGRKSCSLFRAPSRFMGQTADHCAVDAQIRQIAIGQRVQFTNGLAIDRTTGTIFLHVLDRSHQTASEARGSGSIVGMSDSSHGMFLFSVCTLPGWPGAFR